VGWEKVPFLMHLGWAAQWTDYYRELRANLSRPALSLNVFNYSYVQGTPGAVANVTLPPLAALASYQHFEIDFALLCQSPYEASCEIWDRTFFVYVGCNGTASATSELGRWITPFRRGVGRWVTDVSPLLPLLTQQECTFVAQTDSWSTPWWVTVNLRWRNGTDPSPAPINGAYRARELLPLYAGGVFDASYDSSYVPINFTLPAPTKQVLLWVVVSGHGSDEYGCCEFASVTHTFLVNGAFNHSVDFPAAGSQFGCADAVATGGLPNEHGTWLYGRGGWCDGARVVPLVWDLTAEVAPAGVNAVWYQALFMGAPPNGSSSTPAYIILHSYLSFLW
jgi:hypothetical protein